MNDKELIAVKLGFTSAEEMEAYYDLCRGTYKPGVVMTKDMCEQVVIDDGWAELLNAPRETRLEEKLNSDFGALIEAMRVSDESADQEIKDLIDFELSELRKCYAIKEQKSMK